MNLRGLNPPLSEAILILAMLLLRLVETLIPTLGTHPAEKMNNSRLHA